MSVLKRSNLHKNPTFYQIQTMNDLIQVKGKQSTYSSGQVMSQLIKHEWGGMHILGSALMPRKTCVCVFYYYYNLNPLVTILIKSSFSLCTV